MTPPTIGDGPDDIPDDIPAAVVEETRRRFGTTPAEIRAALLPLVRLMYKHGMKHFEVHLEGNQAHTRMM